MFVPSLGILSFSLHLDLLILGKEDLHRHSLRGLLLHSNALSDAFILYFMLAHNLLLSILVYFKKRLAVWLEVIIVIDVIAV